MKNRHRFQSRKLQGDLPQPLKDSSNHANNNNGQSASNKPNSLVEKTIATNITVKPTRNKVAALAYQIYLQQGCPEGRDLQHWLEAEAQLAASSPMSIKTEMTVKTEVNVKNEVGTTAKAGK